MPDMIKNLKIDENGFAKGTFDSSSLFQGEMAVCIFLSDGATSEYAEKCIVHYNALCGSRAILLKLQTYLESFFLYMYNEWREMEIYAEIAQSLEPIMEGYQTGKYLIQYLSHPTLYVDPQRNDDIGYCIECDCPWEPEHQCLMIIRNNDVLYVGPSEGLDPWGKDEDYACIWNEER